MVFQKGQSGNPAGKPPGTRSFTTKVREALNTIAEGKEYTLEEALVKSVLKKAIVDGDATSQKLIWNYLDGLPQQKIDVTSAGEKMGTTLAAEVIEKAEEALKQKKTNE